MGGDEPAHTLIAAALARGQGRRDREQARDRPSRSGARGDRPPDRRGASGSRPRSVAASRSSARSRPSSPANRVSAVRGIVNGTTNYILTAMDRRGPRLRRGPRRGPGRGLRRGRPDAATSRATTRSNKLVILARLAFGVLARPGGDRRRPTPTGRAPAGPGSPASRRGDIAAATSRGDVIKLIAERHGAAPTDAPSAPPSCRRAVAADAALGPDGRRPEPDRDRRRAGRDRRVQRTGRRRRGDLERGPRRPDRDRPRARLDVGRACPRRPRREPRARRRRGLARPDASSIATGRSCPVTDATPA